MAALGSALQSCLLPGQGVGQERTKPCRCWLCIFSNILASKLSDLSISQRSHFKKIPFFSTLAALSCFFPAVSKTLLYILLVRDHLCDTCLASQFPFHSIFSLLFPAPGLLLIPASPELTQEQGRKVAQQLMPVPSLLWSNSRNAVRAGQQCKHQPPFSFLPPALRPHSPSQLHTDLPLQAQFPPPTLGLSLVPCCHKVSP